MHELLHHPHHPHQQYYQYLQHACTYQKMQNKHSGHSEHVDGSSLPVLLVEDNPTIDQNAFEQENDDDYDDNNPLSAVDFNFQFKSPTFTTTLNSLKDNALDNKKDVVNSYLHRSHHLLPPTHSDVEDDTTTPFSRFGGGVSFWIGSCVLVGIASSQMFHQFTLPPS